MRLLRYQVKNFRSIDDSGWIEVENVTALIGVNESGKTNLLLPLWKLNPAREGQLQPTSDYPKKLFGEIRENPERFSFICAEFSPEDKLSELARVADLSEEDVSIVQVMRFYDGRYKISFPNYSHNPVAKSGSVKNILLEFRQSISASKVLKQEEGLKEDLVKEISLICSELEGDSEITANSIEKIRDRLGEMLPETPAKTSVVVPQASHMLGEMLVLQKEVTAPPPAERAEVLKAVVGWLPAFVYYSNYGNLDSEIYLPHVVQNLERSDLGAKEAAKARTLRVLFRFVRLEPEEILELGQDFHDPKDPDREPNSDEIAEIADKKRERSILLQSAGTTLTGKFKDWWKQGDYRFRFEADGNHFRIWVSDDRRPDEVELESRSTGLQWFLSFYLVFLVESTGEHNNAVLLLDEPGMSLHPLAQRDLSAFFESLTSTNQLLYTTHSPFLVDADRLERARKVYVASDGTTKATPDLRQGSVDAKQAGAAYAVHSALNLSVAESLLLGCRPVIVEGGSDQLYLTAIKAILIGAQKISPVRELVFPPSGGAKTVKIVASILTGRDEELPFVLLDGDEAGLRMARELRNALYADAKDRILCVDSYSEKLHAEIEDLLPTDFLAGVVDRWQRSADEEFATIVDSAKPIIPQIEEWAKKESITLEMGWKVELAKRAKQMMLAKGVKAFDDEYVARWVNLFNAFSK